MFRMSGIQIKDQTSTSFKESVLLCKQQAGGVKFGNKHKQPNDAVAVVVQIMTLLLCKQLYRGPSTT